MSLLVCWLLDPLMWSSLIEVHNVYASGDDRTASHARPGNDPGILASRSPETVHTWHSLAESGKAFEAL